MSVLVTALAVILLVGHIALFSLMGWNRRVPAAPVRLLPLPGLIGARQAARRLRRAAYS